MVEKTDCNKVAQAAFEEGAVAGGTILGFFGAGVGAIVGLGKSLPLAVLGGAGGAIAGAGFGVYHTVKNKEYTGGEVLLNAAKAATFGGIAGAIGGGASGATTPVVTGAVIVGTIGYAAGGLSGGTVWSTMRYEACRFSNPGYPSSIEKLSQKINPEQIKQSFLEAKDVMHDMLDFPSQATPKQSPSGKVIARE